MPTAMAAQRIEKELTVLNRHGLHARPAVEFVRCARKFRSKLEIVVRDKRYAADRIMDVLLANLECGCKFILEAEGADASAAVKALEELLVKLREQEDSVEET
jgi:phosphotransferase system HPr (HPr) family protein